MKDEFVLNAEEIALILDISPFTVKLLAKNKDIPCIYKNRRPLFNYEMIIKHFQIIEGGAA